MRWLGLKGIHHIGLADVLEDRCLTPHGLLVLVGVLFRNGLQYKRRPAAGLMAPWLGPWAEATVRCRGFGNVWSPKMSRRSRSKKEVREICMGDVMVAPVPVLHAGQHATGPKWINNSFAASPHVRVWTAHQLMTGG